MEGILAAEEEAELKADRWVRGRCKRMC